MNVILQHRGRWMAIPKLNVKQWLSEREIVYLSVITVEEIYFGLAYRKAKRQLEWFEKFLRFRCSNSLPLECCFHVALAGSTIRLEHNRIYGE